MSGPDYTPAPDWTAMADEVAGETTRRDAYGRLFRSPLGRQVLADILACCGVGGLRGGLVGAPGMLEHAAGLNDAALAILETAGFDQRDVAANLINSSEEGYFDDRHEFE